MDDLDLQMSTVDVVGLVISALSMLLSFIWEPLKRQDRLGNVPSRVWLSYVVCISATVYVYEISRWWLLTTLAIIPYLLGRWFYFKALVKKVDKIERYQQDIATLTLLNKLVSANLYEWEIRKFLLPKLIMYFHFGAINRLKKQFNKLSNYCNNLYYIELKVCLLSISHNSREMVSYLNDIIQKIDVTEGRDYGLLINNLYHAAMMAEDNIAIETTFSKIENYVSIADDASKIPIPMLEAMMYRYDMLNNLSGIERVRALISHQNVKTFQQFLELGDIELFYNRRHNNRIAILKYLDDVLQKAKVMVKSEEDRIRFQLRIVPLYVEFNYGWKEITTELFNDAAFYLNYSQQISFEYLKMLVRVVLDVNRLYNMSLREEQELRLMSQVYSSSSQYITAFKRQLFNLDDNLLYQKREAYRFLVDYAHVGVFLGNSLDLYAMQLIESSQRIITLCRENGETSELLHSLMSYIDEFLELKFALKQELQMGTQTNGIHDAMKRITAEENAVLEYLDELKRQLKVYNYDRTLAYITLWTAHFCASYNDVESAKFHLQKFEEHKISVRNFTKPVEQMYNRLQSWLEQSPSAYELN